MGQASRLDPWSTSNVRPERAVDPEDAGINRSVDAPDRLRRRWLSLPSRHDPI